MSAWRIGRGYLGFGGGRGQCWGMLARHCGNHGGARAEDGSDGGRGFTGSAQAVGEGGGGGGGGGRRVGIAQLWMDGQDKKKRNGHVLM